MKVALAAATILSSAAFATAAETPAPLPASGVAIGIVVANNRAEKVVTLSAAELAKLPHAEVEAGKEHRKYSGVPLAELLRCAGVEWGGKCSPLLTCYVLVEGEDGYCVLFSIPEIDPEQRYKMVILADRCDGKPLSNKDGPYETIEEDAKQHGRWVKQVKAISLQMAARQRPRTAQRQQP